jgi:hypothetical protein
MGWDHLDRGTADGTMLLYNKEWAGIFLDTHCYGFLNTRSTASEQAASAAFWLAFSRHKNFSR